MKAIFIDAENKTVSAVEIENKLETIYAQIGHGCDFVQVVPFDESKDRLIICDEEAVLRGNVDFGFSTNYYDICGNALVCLMGDEEWTDCDLSPEQVEEKIHFWEPIEENHANELDPMTRYPGCTENCHECELLRHSQDGKGICMASQIVYGVSQSVEGK